jgi:hypothetical protein
MFCRCVERKFPIVECNGTRNEISEISMKIVTHVAFPTRLIIFSAWAFHLLCLFLPLFPAIVHFSILRRVPPSELSQALRKQIPFISINVLEKGDDVLPHTTGFIQLQTEDEALSILSERILVCSFPWFPSVIFSFFHLLYSFCRMHERWKVWLLNVHFFGLRFSLRCCFF